MLTAGAALALAGPAQAQEKAAERPGAAAALRIVEGESTLTLHVEKDGWFSSLGHDHTIAARAVTGLVRWDPARLEACSVTLSVATERLEVLDPGVSDKDKAEITAGMRSDKVLDVANHAAIRFASTSVKRTGDAEGGGPRLEVTGDLTLRGATRPVTIHLALEPPAKDRPLRAKGSVAIVQSEFGIEPYSAALGAVEVKDRVVLQFEIVARP